MISEQEFAKFKKHIEAIAGVHPLARQWYDVLEGKKTWDEYHKELRRLHFEHRDESALYVALHHFLTTLKEHPHECDKREFWQALSRTLTYNESDYVYTPRIAKEIALLAAKIGKTRKKPLKMSEYWSALISGSYVEHMKPEEIHELLETIDNAIEQSSRRNHEHLRYALGLADTIVDLTEMLARKAKKHSEKIRWASVSAAAAIRAKTIRTLLARWETEEH